MRARREVPPGLFRPGRAKCVSRDGEFIDDQLFAIERGFEHATVWGSRTSLMDGLPNTPAVNESRSLSECW